MGVPSVPPLRIWDFITSWNSFPSRKKFNTLWRTALFPFVSYLEGEKYDYFLQCFILCKENQFGCHSLSFFLGWRCKESELDFVRTLFLDEQDFCENYVVWILWLCLIWLYFFAARGWAVHAFFFGFSGFFVYFNDFFLPFAYHKKKKKRTNSIPTRGFREISPDCSLILTYPVVNNPD